MHSRQIWSSQKKTRKFSFSLQLFVARFFEIYQCHLFQIFLKNCKFANLNKRFKFWRNSVPARTFHWNWYRIFFWFCFYTHLTLSVTKTEAGYHFQMSYNVISLNRLRRVQPLINLCESQFQSSYKSRWKKKHTHTKQFNPLTNSMADLTSNQLTPFLKGSFWKG